MTSLRALAVLAVTFGLALPGNASATTECNNVVEGRGEGRTPDSMIGVCLDGIGYVEVGSGFFGTYAVASVDGYGYAGISNYETGSKDACSTAYDGGSGTNSGGCLVVGPAAVPVPLIVCGPYYMGEWYSTPTDGCRAFPMQLEDPPDVPNLNLITINTGTEGLVAQSSIEELQGSAAAVAPPTESHNLTSSCTYRLHQPTGLITVVGKSKATHHHGATTTMVRCRLVDSFGVVLFDQTKIAADDTVVFDGTAQATTGRIVVCNAGEAWWPDSHGVVHPLTCADRS